MDGELENFVFGPIYLNWILLSERKKMPVSTRSHALISSQCSKSPAKGNGNDNDDSPCTNQRRTASSLSSKSPFSSKSSFSRIKEKFKAVLTPSRGEDGKEKEKDGERNNQCQKVPSKSAKSKSSTKECHKVALKEESKDNHVQDVQNVAQNQGVAKDSKETLATKDLLNDSSNVGSSRRYFNPLDGFCCVNTKSDPKETQIVSIDTEAIPLNVVPPNEYRDRQRDTDRIMVYVRVRPMSRKEKEAGARTCVRVLNNRELYLTEFATENDYLRLKRLRERHYTFDSIFPDSTGQEEVYNTSTAELVDGVLQGRNASMLCYGATGAGKTHTMLGTVENPGVMVLALKDLFAKLKQRSCNGEHVVCLSYLEVYNELVKDLLSPGRPLVLREDKQGIIAAGLTQYRACSAEEVMALLHQGNQHRSTEPTRMNETSSRSHAILQVVLQYKVKEGPTIVSRTGKLSLIDLAGSERAAATDQRTQRSKEGANINRSLLALSSCINALMEGKKHIPYRNSKLTQLLKDSLGGTCQTAMIANISPSNLSYSETQNTLHWADRAKEIRTKPCIANEGIQIPESQSEQAKVLLETQKENQQLRIQVADLQKKLLAFESQALTSTPSTPVLSPAHPPPFSPSALVKLTYNRYVAKNLQSYALSRNDNVRSAEEIIHELKRNLQALEEESEKQLMSLTHYRVQLKHRDDFIRKICQRLLLANQNHAEPEMIQSNDSVLPSALAETQPSELLKRLMSPKEALRKSVSALQGIYDSHPKSDQQAKGHQCIDFEEKSQSPKLPSPTTGKKRSFWDITNTTNSPEVVQSRSRIAASDAPSMLLKPGFIRYDPSDDN